MPIDSRVVATLETNVILRLNPGRILYYEVLESAPDGLAGTAFQAITNPQLKANWTEAIHQAFALYGQVLDVLFLPKPATVARADIRIGTGTTSLDERGNPARGETSSLAELV